MNHFDPTQTDAQGQAEIASHLYPLTGPYDSSDAAMLEYQVLLMKLSGIDGVIVDWYGFEDFWDYGLINDSTHKLFEYIQKAGLKFVICYEDRTIKNMVDNGHLSATDVYSHGQQAMLYLQDQWFREAAYVKVSGRPVLLVFGNPPYFSRSSDWESLFSVLETAPLLITEDNPISPSAVSSYPWPPMYLAQGQELTHNALTTYLNSFYKKAEAWDYVMAGAFPGFHDIYREAGVGSSYGYLDADDGETLRFTLQAALASDPDVIQLTTWNDYGEGTTLEPTTNFGYDYLEIVQDFRRTSIEAAFQFTKADLGLPLQIFNLRKQYPNDPQVNARLDEAFTAIIAGQLEAATRILADYPTPEP